MRALWPGTVNTCPALAATYVILRCPAQIENEFSFLAKEQGQDETYLRHLTNTAKSALDNNDVTLFTTDPPPDAEKGTLRGELYACVAPWKSLPVSQTKTMEDNLSLTA